MVGQGQELADGPDNSDQAESKGIIPPVHNVNPRYNARGYEQENKCKEHPTLSSG